MKDIVDLRKFIRSELQAQLDTALKERGEAQDAQLAFLSEQVAKVQDSLRPVGELPMLSRLVGDLQRSLDGQAAKPLPAASAGLSPDAASTDPRLASTDHLLALEAEVRQMEAHVASLSSAFNDFRASAGRSGLPPSDPPSASRPLAESPLEAMPPGGNFSFEETSPPEPFAPKAEAPVPPELNSRKQNTKVEHRPSIDEAATGALQLANPQKGLLGKGRSILAKPLCIVRGSIAARAGSPTTPAS